MFPFCVFMLPNSPATGPLLVFSGAFCLFKGWALGFGVSHLYRNNFKFENLFTAIAWWYCFVSLLVSIDYRSVLASEYRRPPFYRLQSSTFDWHIDSYLCWIRIRLDSTLDHRWQRLING